jgi:hypothetical protein
MCPEDTNGCFGVFIISVEVNSLPRHQFPIYQTVNDCLTLHPQEMAIHGETNLVARRACDDPATSQI